MWLLVVLTSTMLIKFAVLRHLRFDAVVVGLALGSTVVDVDYLAYTSVSDRNYDASSHLEYIQTIVERGQLPDASSCGACGHPPLYYALAACWTRIFGSVAAYELALQWLSLLLFFAFVVCALLIVRSCTNKRGTVWLALALISFWPSSIINSVRVHNDALASVTMLAAIYFTAQWDRLGRQRYFNLALLFCCLALLTKSSGYVVVATLLSFATLRWIKEGNRAAAWRLLMAVSILACAASFATLTRESSAASTLCQRVLGNACDGRYVPVVPDRASRFYSFDIGRFVTRMDTMPDDPERDYFFNRVAKSMLFGVISLGDEFDGTFYQTLAMIMSVLLLVMAAVGVLSLLALHGLHFRKYRVYWSATLIALVFLLAFRIRAPNEFHEDFRHIFFTLVPLCLGYAKLVERLRRVSRFGAALALVAALGMIGSSLAFFFRVPSALACVSVPCSHASASTTIRAKPNRAFKAPRAHVKRRQA